MYELQMLLTNSDFKVAVAEIDRIIGMPELAVWSKGTDRRPQASGAIVATYDYVDEDGHLLLQCVRYDPKDFRQHNMMDQDGSGI